MLAPPATAPADTRRRDVAEGDLFFDPRVKCCTYIPALPNFLVGRILLDRTPEAAPGRASVEGRMAAGVGVTPAGLEQPPVFTLLYRNATDVFGRGVGLRCPHYLTDTGQCGIWRHRQSVCSTWFCKYVRGAVGLRFWRTLRHLLDAVERGLAAHCVRTLDPGPNAVARLIMRPDTSPQVSAVDVGGVPDAEGQRLAWGRYAGREREFYEASARLVERFSWSDVSRVAGAEVALAATLVKATYHDLGNAAVPRRLRSEAAVVESVDADHVRLSTYNALDPLVIPRALGDALHHFDGRPTRAALAAITADTGLELERAAVRRLVDFEVVVDADRPPGARR
jgi:Fe-S-cluster containining protein